MTLTLKNSSNPPVTVFSMSGVWLSNLTTPEEDWSVQISGSAKGTISPSNPLTIVADPDYPYVLLNVLTSGSGLLSDGVTPISISGDFYLTPAKTVYGFYNLTIAGNTPRQEPLQGHSIQARKNLHSTWSAVTDINIHSLVLRRNNNSLLKSHLKTPRCGRGSL